MSRPAKIIIVGEMLVILVLYVISIVMLWQDGDRTAAKFLVAWPLVSVVLAITAGKFIKKGAERP